MGEKKYTSWGLLVMARVRYLETEFDPSGLSDLSWKGMWPMANFMTNLMTNLMAIFKNLINKEFAVNKYNLKFMVRLFNT